MSGRVAKADYPIAVIRGVELGRKATRVSARQHGSWSAVPIGLTGEARGADSFAVAPANMADEVEMFNEPTRRLASGLMGWVGNRLPGSTRLVLSRLRKLYQVW